MIIYISGPITGIENNNREAFYAKERELRNFGKDADQFEVINPAKIAILVDYEGMSKNCVPSWEDYMRNCIRELCRATHITFLSGYEKSKGAMLEKKIAEKLGIAEF